MPLAPAFWNSTLARAAYSAETPSSSSPYEMEKRAGGSAALASAVRNLTNGSFSGFPGWPPCQLRANRGGGERDGSYLASMLRFTRWMRL